MRYPSLSSDDIFGKLDALISGAVPDLTADASEVGEGAMVDLADLSTAVEAIRVAWSTRLAGEGEPDVDEDQFEGAMASILWDALSDWAIEVLDDPGFWAYLAAGPMWFFVRWREDPAKRQREGYHEYLDGRVNHACVPLRMFLRAQAVDNSGDTSLAAAIAKGTDFWRSHVIRVKTGAKTELARAVTEQQVASRMSVYPLRQYAKRINRRWSNEVMWLLDEAESREIAADERE